MTDFKKLSDKERRKIKEDLLQRYREFQAQGLTLDMTRGKPCVEQLDLSLGMLDGDIGGAYLTPDGLDCRNYGGLDGIPAAKELIDKAIPITDPQSLNIKAIKCITKPIIVVNKLLFLALNLGVGIIFITAPEPKDFSANFSIP